MKTPYPLDESLISAGFRHYPQLLVALPPNKRILVHNGYGADTVSLRWPTEGKTDADGCDRKEPRTEA
jgi:hypothetical protein